MHLGHVRVSMFIVIIMIIAVIDTDNPISFGSFPDKNFVSLGPHYILPHIKQTNKKNNIPPPVDDSRMCLLGMCYNADVQKALGNLCKLDGEIPVHEKFGMPVNIFAPQKLRKYWTKPSKAELGYCVQCFVHY